MVRSADWQGTLSALGKDGNVCTLSHDCKKVVLAYSLSLVEKILREVNCDPHTTKHKSKLMNKMLIRCSYVPENP